MPSAPKMFKYFSQSPLVLRYGLLLAAGIVMLKTLEYRLFSFRLNQELYSGLLSLFFLLLGVTAMVTWKRLKQSSAKPLTATERRILAGLLQGHSNQQLADANHVSVNTIKTHLKNLYRKLQVRNRAEAVLVAQKSQMI